MGVDFYEMAHAYLVRAASQNVCHAKVFVSPQAHLRRGIAIEVVIKNVRAAFARLFR
jgi:adenosine deaminase